MWPFASWGGGSWDGGGLTPTPWEDRIGAGRLSAPGEPVHPCAESRGPQAAFFCFGLTLTPRTETEVQSRLNSPRPAPL